MCGIVGYIGNQKASEILINGLKRMEYRGYDSSGLAVIEDGNLDVIKQVGKVVELENITSHDKLSSKIGIAHTRWATHGFPNQTNAHPHYDNSRNIAVVHNGIVENYAAIKTKLIQEGYSFSY